MKTTLRLIPALLFALAAPLAVAQETVATPEPTATSSRSETARTTAVETRPATTTAVDSDDETSTASTDGEQKDQTSYRTREQFNSLLRENPPELARILVLDPSLLTNKAFLSGYPSLAQFVERHPEVTRNSNFYLGAFDHQPVVARSATSEVFEQILIFGIFAFIATVLAWLVRTTIEQKRWNRLSRIQTEVHNKILDRFGTTTELMEYIRTPAGSRFLESAPIPLHTVEPERNDSQLPSLGRVGRSLHIGIVVAAAALGMLLVSGRFGDEGGEVFFALGMIAFSIGVGFVASAVLSLFMARRLATPAGAGETVNERVSDLGHGR